MKNKLLALRLSCRFFYPQGRSLRLRLEQAAACLYCPSFRAAREKRERLFRSCGGSDRIANYCGAWGKKEIVPADWFGEGTSLFFEGLELVGPKQYDRVLTQLYGDYMQLPPEEKRLGHHGAEVIDTEKPYTQYLKNE